MSSQPIAFYRTKVAVAIVAACALGFALFQNCAKVAATDLNNSDPQAIKENVPTDPETLIKNCADAKAAGRLHKVNADLNFTNNERCEWEKNGNLSMVEGLVRARKERYLSAAIPADATVCNIKMTDFSSSTFYYDDNIILTLNDIIMSSTTDFTRHFDKLSNYFKYDWTRFVDKPAQNGKPDTTPDKQYCAGKSEGLSSCLFPETETTGKIQLNFDEKVIQTVLGLTNPRQLKLGLITTGDNDDTKDCMSTPINFAAEVEYY